MWIDDYAKAAERHCDEIVDEFEQMGFNAVSEEVHYLGGQKIFEYLNSNIEMVKKCATATPSFRKKYTNSMSESEKIKLLLASFLYAYWGVLLLQQISRRPLGPGGRYRQLHAVASEAALQFQQSAFDWPLKDIASPFDSD